MPPTALSPALFVLPQLRPEDFDLSYPEGGPLGSTWQEPVAGDVHRIYGVRTKLAGIAVGDEWSRWIYIVAMCAPQLVVLAHALRKKGVSPEKIAFAMFKTTGSERENAAARQYLTEAGYLVLDGEVGVSTAYGSASDAGKAITETSFRTLNERASKLAQSVIDKMAELQERQVA